MVSLDRKRGCEDRCFQKILVRLHELLECFSEHMMHSGQKYKGAFGNLAHRGQRLKLLLGRSGPNVLHLANLISSRSVGRFRLAKSGSLANGFPQARAPPEVFVDREYCGVLRWIGYFSAVMEAGLSLILATQVNVVEPARIPATLYGIL